VAINYYGNGFLLVQNRKLDTHWFLRVQAYPGCLTAVL
jgi:hypothetical protein